MPPDAIPIADIRRALVIMLRHHGDTLLASPVCTVLARRGIGVDALVYADSRAMLELHPGIQAVHVIDRAWRSASPFVRLAREWALARALRARGYDLVVHLGPEPRGAWLARWTRARYRVAPAARRDRYWLRSFTHLYPTPANPGRHRVERNLDALRRIGLQPDADERRLVLVPGETAQERVQALLAEHGLGDGPHRQRGFVHLHPASRWRFKCWTVAGHAELIERLAELGWAVVLTAAPDPVELAMVEEIARRSRAPVISLAGQLGLKELAALSTRAALFVGVDSAPMHIAAAVGTPVVALFGPSGDLEWGPWGVPHRVVASRTHSCRPCGLDGCGGGKISECLVSLSAESVTHAALSLLAGLSPPGASAHVAEPLTRVAGSS